MKRLLPILLAGCFLLLALSGCSSPDNASSGEASAAASSAPAALLASSSPATDGGDTQAQDVNALLATLSEAAGLGATIDVMELDLTAGGITMDNIVAWAGAESKTASENGGIVIVFQVQPGTAGALKSELEAFRDSRLDDRYAEFATAMANTKEARIVDKGDLVIYAVSANGADGGYDTLDAAIDQISA